ncbi:alpha/beta hydrolase [Capsulimonas corticalis]|uniref:Alpha/beta hydrolase n=1 Tax=Capsulimonas corticalis TaxID=2219043 RepID=A0A402CT96_9BACT|nr:alpha/beta hydrolase [Capsulimonas corticalis]BDI30814.1 alpha/beta hydrolase [Capsulimonas corticalis]
MNLIPAAVALATVIAASVAAPSEAAAPAPSAKPTIVLVHGAFADATGWQHVIPLLEDDGYTVIAVQNSLFSLSEDIITTKRVLEAQTGPVVVVGHSYGGAVISGAAGGEANVKALVYIAAFAPDANEAVGAFFEKYPTALGASVHTDTAGFGYIDRAKYHAIFCADVSDVEARVMAAAQKPILMASFGASSPSAAWRTIPSWYMVAQGDLSIHPDLERFYAKRMGAHTTEIKASHCAFISHPKEIAAFIEQAAAAVTK